jgi:hypothetical protein
MGAVLQPSRVVWLPGRKGKEDCYIQLVRIRQYLVSLNPIWGVIYVNSKAVPAPGLVNPSIRPWVGDLLQYIVSIVFKIQLLMDSRRKQTLENKGDMSHCNIVKAKLATALENKGARRY